MKVFISWSGERSRRIADTLRLWLNDVVQDVEPWMSAADIDAGTRWAATLTQQLADTRFGIVCLTPENANAPWILFEAGALSKAIGHGRVCPYLFDLTPSQVKGPLSQFQANSANYDGTFAIVTAMNAALGDQKLDDARLERSFARCWPELDESIRDIPARPTDSPRAIERRSDSEMIEEVLMLVRTLVSQQPDADTLKVHEGDGWPVFGDGGQHVTKKLPPEGLKALFQAYRDVRK